ncbi:MULTISPECIES: endonuclease/exonuclease/phosphatase family protein [Cyanophyceae]|uniref:endonuclease/exonuclease/phosphatase family protein n=1 Tax=Cyanophyceae TaxID=3028117 RepID=UPI001682B30A|nr:MULTISPECIES: endonuclease/exonuclease/phosphatase family protein [Cyanophyceae]MBD1918023.1 endonuclease/exonuclease/phosphatase family protein [Phormidium sp. FACHB-77]MBD2029271.1 endonuclease/exonuclease/phosphatase family protein [Phormidium sp. FACHB-322]MBD2049803.1 endonuclease/exonuclease/phosphatase family protein [Leptolyngbya sp. FACHB-60]
MKNVFVTVSLALGLPVTALVGTFVYISSPNWKAADYDNLVTYEAYPPGVTNPEQLSVVSYNIGYLSGLTNQQAVERDKALFEVNQATAIAALQTLQPDILALQEIDFDAYRSFNLNQQYAVAAALEMAFGAIAVNWDKRYVPFPYWPPQAHYKQVISGQAVLSRYPVRRNERLVLEKVPTNPFYYNALYLDRVAQVTEIDVSGQTLIVINVHLEAFDAPTRIRQTQVVRELAEGYAEDYPVLLLGDFNSSLNRNEGDDPRSIQFLLDSPVLTSALPTAPSSFTFPSDQPQYVLDYIFYTPATLDLVTAEVVAEAAQASDHLPIQAQVRLR